MTTLISPFVRLALLSPLIAAFLFRAGASHSAHRPADPWLSDTEEMVIWGRDAAHHVTAHTLDDRPPSSIL